MDKPVTTKPSKLAKEVASKLHRIEYAGGNDGFVKVVAPIIQDAMDEARKQGIAWERRNNSSPLVGS